MENKQLKSFKDLIVWQKSSSLAVLAYSITEKFPRSELYGLTNQMRRSAVSISSNIAEGFKRNHNKEKLQFYNIAYGSVAELESQIEIASKLNFLNKEAHQNLNTLVVEVGKMLDGLIKSVNKSSKSYILNPIFFFALLYSIFYILNPAPVYAATTIYFDLENPVIYEGDIFLVDLKISTPEKSINVVDGTILYDNSKLEIKEVSTGNSLFALWPKPPAFSNDKGILSFVGGVPDGFQDKGGEVLKIIFLAKSEGEAQIDFLDGFSIFLHDGKGTQINPWLRPFSLNILKRPPEIQAKDEWRDLVAKDKTPPESFEITPGKDLSVFNNQYFISFFATDAESGIAYYEVQEGERDFVRVESPYLLKDQSLQGLIKVRAVDKAGNERIEELMPSAATAPTAPFYKNVLFWIAAFIIIIMVIFYIFWRNFMRKMKI